MTMEENRMSRKAIQKKEMTKDKMERSGEGRGKNMDWRRLQQLWKYSEEWEMM